MDIEEKKRIAIERLRVLKQKSAEEPLPLHHLVPPEPLSPGRPKKDPKPSDLWDNQEEFAPEPEPPTERVVIDDSGDVPIKWTYTDPPKIPAPSTEQEYREGPRGRSRIESLNIIAEAPDDHLKWWHEKFIMSYAIDFDIRKAMKSIGFHENTAWSDQIAAAWLAHPLIQSRLDEISRDVAKSAGVTKLGVVNELKALAFSDISTVCEWDENGEGFKVKSSKDIDTRAIKKIKVTEFKGKNPRTETIIEMWDKPAAIDKLSQHLGYKEAEKKEVSITGVANLMDLARLAAGDDPINTQRIIDVEAIEDEP